MEHTEAQLAQCRERLVARAEQLMQIDAAGRAGGGDGGGDGGGGDGGGGGGGGDGGDAAAEARARAVAAAAVEIAEDLRRLRESRLCCVCLRKERDAVLLPCRHEIMCEGCARHVEGSSRRCPLCRGAIESTIRVFK